MIGNTGVITFLCLIEEFGKLVFIYYFQKVHVESKFEGEDGENAIARYHPGHIKHIELKSVKTLQSFLVLLVLNFCRINKRAIAHTRRTFFAYFPLKYVFLSWEPLEIIIKTITNLIVASHVIKTRFIIYFLAMLTTVIFHFILLGIYDQNIFLTGLFIGHVGKFIHPLEAD